MEKYTKHAPLALFCLAIGKLLILPATWEGAAAALVAGLLAGAYELKNNDKKNKELQDKIDNMTKDLAQKIDLVSAVVNNHAKAIEETKSGMSTIKIAQQLQSQKITSNPVQRVF